MNKDTLFAVMIIGSALIFSVIMLFIPKLFLVLALFVPYIIYELKHAVSEEDLLK